MEHNANGDASEARHTSIDELALLNFLGHQMLDIKDSETVKPLQVSTELLRVLDEWYVANIGRHITPDETYEFSGVFCQLKDAILDVGHVFSGYYVYGLKDGKVVMGRPHYIQAMVLQEEAS